jgi:hypothetical protein
LFLDASQRVFPEATRADVEKFIASALHDSREKAAAKKDGQ